MFTPSRIISFSFLSVREIKTQQLSSWLFHSICSAVSKSNVLLRFSIPLHQLSAHYCLRQTREMQLNCSRSGSHSWIPPSAFFTFPSVVMGWCVFHSANGSLYLTWVHYHHLHCSFHSTITQFSAVRKKKKKQPKTILLCCVLQWKICPSIN